MKRTRLSTDTRRTYAAVLSDLHRMDRRGWRPETIARRLVAEWGLTAAREATLECRTPLERLVFHATFSR